MRIILLNLTCHQALLTADLLSASDQRKNPIRPTKKVIPGALSIVVIGVQSTCLYAPQVRVDENLTWF